MSDNNHIAAILSLISGVLNLIACLGFFLAFVWLCFGVIWLPLGLLAVMEVAGAARALGGQPLGQGGPIAGIVVSICCANVISLGLSIAALILSGSK